MTLDLDGVVVGALVATVVGVWTVQLVSSWRTKRQLDAEADKFAEELFAKQRAEDLKKARAAEWATAILDKARMSERPDDTEYTPPVYVKAIPMRPAPFLPPPDQVVEPTPRRVRELTDG